MNQRPITRDARSLGVATLLVALLLAALAEDSAITSAVMHLPVTLVTVGLFVTEFGTSGYMFAFSGLIACGAILAIGRGHFSWRGTPLCLVAGRASYFFAAIAASGLAAQAIKHLVGRARPVRFAAEGPFSLHPLSWANDLASFPSGHTTSAFAAAVALGLIRPRWRWWLLCCALLIGVSRVIVGAHYPSDVVGGAALGTAASLVVARIFARLDLAFDVEAGQDASTSLVTASSPRSGPA